MAEPTLFPVPEPIGPSEYQEASADRRRTMRAQVAIANGVHPFGMPLRSGGDETCGSCCHAFRVDHRSRHYWKCEKRGDTSSAASDLRLKWPACVYWEAKP